ncbi:MAG: hypothetical protein IJ104_10835 [Methanobrevibacter sp.]|nr:hypothetical protein [Methanobrevibacter sp.]
MYVTRLTSPVTKRCCPKNNVVPFGTPVLVTPAWAPVTNRGGKSTKDYVGCGRTLLSNVSLKWLLIS